MVLADSQEGGGPGHCCFGAAVALPTFQFLLLESKTFCILKSLNWDLMVEKYHGVISLAGNIFSFFFNSTLYFTNQCHFGFDEIQ